MTTQLMQKVHVIEGTEYERGWGYRPDGLVAFKTKELALAYIANYHETFNTATSAPDCYTVYAYAGEHWANEKFVSRFKLNEFTKNELVHFGRLAELEAP